MIAAAMLTAVVRGYLPAVPYLNPALETAETLLTEYLSDDGDIFSACFGPGPLVATTDYLAPREFPPNDAHGLGAFCMLAAALGEVDRSPLPLRENLPPTSTGGRNAGRNAPAPRRGRGGGSYCARGGNRPLSFARMCRMLLE